LVEAGWVLRPTVEGLGLEPPAGLEDEDAIAKKLDELGIELFPEEMPSRTWDEIADAGREFFDRIWYERKLVYLAEPASEHKTSPNIIAGMLKAMREVEEKYGKDNLKVENDFDWGMINGKLSALRWLEGNEWDFLDT
jgi:hypothetical protein